MNGASWADAAPGGALQSIINNAIAGDEVWVACGTYNPTSGTDRNASFSMKNGVAIYGGFDGTEAQLADRTLACGPCSILSGEIGSPGTSDNSFTVVWNEQLDSTAVLDGFTLRDGNDDRVPTSDGHGLGGGLYNHGFGPFGTCSPVIRNCFFTANFASWGAGAFNNGYDDGNAEPYYMNCIFYRNHAYIEAGGMDSYGVGGNASPTVVNSLFVENSSATNVGAMYAWGGNFNGNCHPVLINCVFANNTATNGYGGAFIADNLDENGSSSMGSCTVTLQNCIVWNNTATGQGPQFYVRGAGAQVLATYSNIDLTGQTGTNIIAGPGTGNLNIAPGFADINNAMGPDSCWFTADDGLRLLSNSLLINAGNLSGAPTTDITGTPRIGNPDLGAYEYEPVLSVNPSLSSNIEISPNPGHQFLQINRKIGSQTTAVILNSMGHIVRVIKLEGQTRVDMSDLPSGIYWISISGEKTQKWIKH